MKHLLKREIVASAEVSKASPAEVAREFRSLLERGCELRPAGEAKRDPLSMLRRGYAPRYTFDLFDTRYYLSSQREDRNFRFFVAYVLPTADPTDVPRGRAIHPRIFYKDVSLVWRVATHYIRSDEDNWIGKGDLKCAVENGVEMEYSAEETTNLPFEIQGALDAVSRAVRRARRDDDAVALILRKAPDGRFEPYADFLGPRRRAMADAHNLINRRALRRPLRTAERSLLVAIRRGLRTGLRGGIVEVSRSGSRIYGGKLRKLPHPLEEREIQYSFIAAPRRVWIIPPQTLTTELVDLWRADHRRRRRRRPLRAGLRVSLHGRERRSAAAPQPDSGGLRGAGEQSRSFAQLGCALARKASSDRRISAQGVRSEAAPLMASLLDETALEPCGRGLYTREIAAGAFWGAGSAHGGYVMALLLHAMVSELGDPLRRPRVFAHQFLGRVLPGVARIEVEAERAGRSVSSLRARMHMGDELLASASCVFAVDREGPAFCDDAMPRVAPAERPDAGMLGFDVAPVHERFDFHRRFGCDGAALPNEDGGWVVPLAREEWDYRLVLLVSDLWCPPTIRHPERVCATPSLHHVVHLGSQLRGEAGASLLVRHTASSGGAGLTDEDISLWADDGRLLLRGRQLRQVVDLSRLSVAR